jgi:hypothetical protein
LSDDEEEKCSNAREEDCGGWREMRDDGDEEGRAKHGGDMLETGSDGHWPAQALVWCYDAT